jgi:hypothetical protein
VIGPSLTADALFAFDERNNICEVGFGKATVARILDQAHVIVGAFAGVDTSASPAQHSMGCPRPSWSSPSTCADRVREQTVGNAVARLEVYVALDVLVDFGSATGGWTSAWWG